MEEFMAEYAHKDSRVYKLKQDGTTIFLPGISDRKGLDKVPFAFNFQGKEITKKEAQKYYSYSKTIEEILKNPKKKKKKIFTTFFGHIYYSNHNENPAMKLITSIESIFSLYIFSFLEYPLSGLCPDCGEEVIFEYRKIHKGRIPQNFFSHKQVSVSKKHCDFVYETGKHLKARLAVAEAIEKEEDICLLRKCSKCHKISKQYFPIKSFKSSLTHILPSGHRADVALFDKDDNLKTIIEIIDEKTIPPEKENDLKDISWGEFTAETILGSNNWLVKRDFFKAYICPKCKEIQNKDIPKTITQNPPIPTGTGKIRLESENYYFEIKLLLKEEFRYSPEMINLVIKELEEFWCFKVTKIQVFYTDGSSKNIYTYDYSEKLPSDKDDMVVVSFILNSYYHYGSYRVGHYLNALWQNPNKLPHPSKDSRIQSMSGIYLPYKDQKTLIKLLSILSRFFLMPKEE